MVGHNHIRKEGLVLFYFTTCKLCEAKDFLLCCILMYTMLPGGNIYLIFIDSMSLCKGTAISLLWK